MDTIIGLAGTAAFLGLIIWITRVGPSVDDAIVRLTSKYFNRTANLLSWIMCIFTLIHSAAIITTYGIVGMPAIVAILPIVSVVQFVLLILRRFPIAYWAATGEFLIALVNVSSLIFGDPETNRAPLLDIRLGSFGFLIWMGVAFILATAGWICHRAAKDIWNEA